MITYSPGLQGHPVRQRGLTLVELLISLFLGALLSAGMVSLYIDSKSNYWAEEEMARLQENGRYAISLMKRELSMAGFLGGNLDVGTLAAEAIATDCASSNWALNTSSTLEFVNNHDSGSSPVTSSGTTLSCIDGTEIQPLTDVLVIKRSSSEPAYKHGSFASAFTASPQEEWFLKFENYGSSISWSKFSPEQLQDPNDPLDPTGVGDELSYWKYHAKVFFIRDHSETAGDQISTLCMQALEGNEMVERCLVEGIEELHVEFGIDPDADGVVNQYVESPTAAEIEDAVVARIYILARSLDELTGYTNTKSYELGKRVIGSKNDGYLRRVFVSTVQMRNAVLPTG